jgi:hypothetical protein
MQFGRAEPVIMLTRRETWGHIERSGKNPRRVTDCHCTLLDCLDCRPFSKNVTFTGGQRTRQQTGLREAVVLGGQMATVVAGETCRSWRGVRVRWGERNRHRVLVENSEGDRPHGRFLKL